MREFLFVDGASFERAVLKTAAQFLSDTDLHEALNFFYLSGGYQRVFYYDCLPAKAPNQSDTEFTAHRERKQQFQQN